MLGVQSDRPQRLGDGAEQDSVDDPLILKCHGAECPRQREDDVMIGDREQVVGSGFQPLGAARSLALGAMTVAAGAIGDLLMAALVTAAHPPAQSSGAAESDVPKGFSLLAREGMIPLEVRLTAAEDIGRFQPMPHHRLRSPPGVVANRSAARGFPPAAETATCR
jgi:hypothetical protein